MTHALHTFPRRTQVFLMHFCFLFKSLISRWVEVIGIIGFPPQVQSVHSSCLVLIGQPSNSQGASLVAELWLMCAASVKLISWFCCQLPAGGGSQPPIAALKGRLSITTVPPPSASPPICSYSIHRWWVTFFNLSSLHLKCRTVLGFLNV